LSKVFRYANTWPLGARLVESGAIDLDVLVANRFVLARAE
jgi:L-iditol 2-dehydrogenase